MVANLTFGRSEYCTKFINRWRKEKWREIRSSRKLISQLQTVVRQAKTHRAIMQNIQKKKRRFEVANDSLIEFTISYHESLKEKKSGSSADSIPNRLTRREANELFLSTTRTETKCSWRNIHRFEFLRLQRGKRNSRTWKSLCNVWLCFDFPRIFPLYAIAVFMLR